MSGTAAGAGAGPGPELPDLSHLTEEERSIILSVMERQRKEEEKEQSMLRYGGAGLTCRTRRPSITADQLFLSVRDRSNKIRARRFRCGFSK